MFKKYLLFTLFILVKCGLEAFEIPHHFFYIDTPKTYDFGTSVMPIQTDDKSLGLIKRHVSGSLWQRIPQYELYSAQEGIEAFAEVDSTDQKHKVIFSIKDKNDQLLGKIEENWEDTYFYSPTLKIYSADHKLLATGKWDSGAFSCALTLTDPLDQRNVVSFVSQGTILRGPWFPLIQDPEFLDQIHSSLLILCLAIASDCDFHYRLCGYKSSLSTHTQAFQEELKLYESHR